VTGTKIIALYMLVFTGSIVITNCVLADKPPPLPEGTIPLTQSYGEHLHPVDGSKPPTKRRCLHGHWAVPMPFDVTFDDGTTIVHIDLCPVCVLETLQKLAGYPPPKEKK